MGAKRFEVAMGVRWIWAWALVTAGIGCGGTVGDDSSRAADDAGLVPVCGCVYSDIQDVRDICGGSGGFVCPFCPIDFTTSGPDACAPHPLAGAVVWCCPPGF